MAITLLKFQDGQMMVGDAATVTSLSLKNPRYFYEPFQPMAAPMPAPVYKFDKLVGDPAILNFQSKDIKWRYVITDPGILAGYNATTPQL